MKLYYFRGACSLSPHIILKESGLPFELVKVDTETGLAGGRKFIEINPKDYVPVLELDNGEVLTEGAVIVQYIADLVPEKNLIPKVGTKERYRCQEWLNYIGAEIHKGFGPLFMDEIPDDFEEVMKNRLRGRIDFAETHLSKNEYLMGSQFSVADAYLFTVMSWCTFMKIDTSKWPATMAYVDKIKKRPATIAALADEKAR